MLAIKGQIWLPVPLWGVLINKGRSRFGVLRNALCLHLGAGCIEMFPLGKFMELYTCDFYTFLCVCWT